MRGFARRAILVVLPALAAIVSAGCQAADPYYRLATAPGGGAGPGGDAGPGSESDAGGNGVDRRPDNIVTKVDAADEGSDAGEPNDTKFLADAAGSDGDDAGGCGDCALTVLYWCEGTEANTIRATFSLVNDTGTNVSLSEVTVRYWFTGGPAGAPWDFACDNGMLGVTPDNVDVTVDVTNVFRRVTPSRPGADMFFEVGFTAAAGDLMPGQQSLFRTRVFRDDYSTINQNDDYSFGPQNMPRFKPWSHVTLYRNGTLIDGVEPPAR
ncbi:MAG TPA: cellulose binding domain-containing protein [Polyangia bacterium]|jgi:hypothetical protein|nr:cellulose binding domain-containing protein [Polyangia bacterium]